jgi:hypothetical protein
MLEALPVATAEVLAAEAAGAAGPLEFWTDDGRQAVAARFRGPNVLRV